MAQKKKSKVKKSQKTVSKAKTKKGAKTKVSKTASKTELSKSKKAKKQNRAASSKLRANTRSETPHFDTRPERGQIASTDTNVEIAKGAAGESFETDSRPD